jgi:hypothetical protein
MTSLLLGAVAEACDQVARRRLLSHPGRAPRQALPPRARDQHLEGETQRGDAFRLLGFSKLATLRELGHRWESLAKDN